MKSIRVGKQVFTLDAVDAAQAAIDANEKAMQQIADNRDAIQAALEEAKAKVAKLEALLAATAPVKEEAAAAEEPAAETPPTEEPPSLDAMSEEKMPAEVLDAMVLKREQLRADARKVLGDKAKLDGLTSKQIKTLCVTKALPGVRTDALDAKALDSVFVGVVARAAEKPAATPPTTETPEVRNDALGAARPAPPVVRTDADDPVMKMIRSREEQYEKARKGTR